MISCRIEHHKVFVEKASKEELKGLKKALNIHRKKFRPAPGERPYTTENLFISKDKSFPTGYLDTIKKKLSKLNIEIKFTDSRVYRRNTQNIKQKKSFDHEPRRWQEEANKKIKDNPAGFISAATASGKSRVIYTTIIDKNVKTLIIVPTTNIQYQIKEQLESLIGKSNISTKIPRQTEEEYLAERKKIKEEDEQLMKDFMESNRENSEQKGLFKHTISKEELRELYDVKVSLEKKYLEDKGHTDENKIPQWKKKKIVKKKTKEAAVTISCFQSLDEYSHEFLNSVECVIIDEGHHSSSVTIREALLMMPNACYRYGFSATPWRDNPADMKLLTAALGENIIYEYNPDEAMEDDVIAVPDYEIIHPGQPDDFLRDIKHWRTIVEKGIVGNRVRNEIIVDKALEEYYEDNNVLICVDEIAHAEIIEERILNEDDQANIKMIHGQRNKKKNQEDIKEAGEARKGIITIGTMAIGEGTDMPNINVVILASGGKSSIKLLQRIGRSLRKTKDKINSKIYDFHDWFNPITMRHSKSRQTDFKKYYKID